MKKAFTTALAVILVLATVLSLASCSLQSKLVGTWKGSANEYTFNDDGTGTLSVPHGVGVPFKYTVEKDQLTITEDTVLSEPKVYTATIKGDTLTLADSSETITLTKQK